MRFILSRDPKFLSNLFCGCGKPAELGWHLPIEKEKPKKLSKTDLDDGPKGPKEPQPYGWACNPHVPPEIASAL